jgi:hypothetical protein
MIPRATRHRDAAIVVDLIIEWCDGGFAGINTGSGDLWASAKMTSYLV